MHPVHFNLVSLSLGRSRMMLIISLGTGLQSDNSKFGTNMIRSQRHRGYGIFNRMFSCTMRSTLIIVKFMKRPIKGREFIWSGLVIRLGGLHC